MTSQKKILKGFSIEEVSQEGENLVIIGRVCTGNICLGDHLNSLYKVGVTSDEVKNDLEANYLISDVRKVEIIVKAIGFRQKFVKEVYCGHVAKFTLEGDGFEKINREINFSNVDLLGVIIED